MSDTKYDGTQRHTTVGYTDIKANDYGLSDIRAYLNNLSENGFISSIQVSVNNIVYQLIKGRPIKDLYVDLDIDETNTNYALSLAGEKSILNQSDKFWLMSNSEVNNFFPEKEDKIWSGEMKFWLRSPYATHAISAAYVNNYGELHTFSVGGKFGIRPAFKI